MFTRITQQLKKIWPALRLGLIFVLLVMAAILQQNIARIEILLPDATLEKVYSASRDEKYQVNSNNEAADGHLSAEEIISVSITGAVNKPGVYQLPISAITAELFSAAEGLAKDADKTYVSREINMAANLSAGIQIYVPYKSELALVNSNGANSSGSSSSSSLVNINSATSEQLETLPGVGPSLAEKIIAARPYSDIKDLNEVSGIGEATYQKLVELITI